MGELQAGQEDLNNQQSRDPTLIFGEGYSAKGRMSIARAGRAGKFSANVG